MSKLAILYVCTGKYTVFWREFYDSCEAYFLPNCEKHYFVFTDADSIEHEAENAGIHRIFQQALAWPYPTLLRYKMFLRAEELLRDFDYIFFFNANAQFVREVSEAMILPRAERGEDLVVVRHPGFYNKENDVFTYDRNPRSRAFIPYGRGRVYVCGGINGGTAEAYLRLCHTISERTDADLKKGVIALWHDESHLNKYILRYRSYRLLTPAYCQPSQPWWKLPYEPVILVRDKADYFDVAPLRGDTPEDQSPAWARQLNRVGRKLAHFGAFRALMNLGVTKVEMG